MQAHAYKQASANWSVGKIKNTHIHTYTNTYMYTSAHKHTQASDNWSMEKVENVILKLARLAAADIGTLEPRYVCVYVCMYVCM